MENGISREEHNEFVRRMEDEHKRINRRVATLEDTVRQIGELTASVKQLAQSVESMAKSQGKQEERLEELDNRDGEMWRKVSSYVLTTIIGAVLTFVMMQIGIR